MYVSMCIYINNNSNNNNSNSNSMAILINLIYLNQKKKRMCGFKCRRTTYNSKGYYR
ncbi:hypothetical protein MEQ_00607 [Candida albicans P87]|nr:hypothetical protein MEQ_00607 [Candida albicans P87]